MEVRLGRAAGVPVVDPAEGDLQIRLAGGEVVRGEEVLRRLDEPVVATRERQGGDERHDVSESHGQGS